MLLFSFAMLYSINAGENPLLQNWETPFGTPPFGEIKTEHYLPAFQEAIKLHNEEILKIASNEQEPSFENTIEALEYSGDKLKQVQRVFSAMNGAMNNSEMTNLSKEISPMLSKHNDDINLNEKLFGRIKSVFDQKENLNLTTEQEKVLEKYYKGFVRGGANLTDEQKNEFREINKELSILSVQFGENVLKETNKFELIIEDESDLSGLPENVKSTASNAASEKGYDGKWLFTIQKPSMLPFLQYSDKRELREKLYKGYYMKGDNNDELDNKKNLSRMAMLRVKRANILGYKTHADFVLEETMAANPKNVYDLLEKLWKPALERAIVEKNDMQNMIKAEGGDFDLASWDWWYYAEKVKKEKYD